MTYVSAMKMCTRCSASFSYSRLASSTSRLRMSLFRATTLSGAIRVPRWEKIMFATCLILSSAQEP